MAKQQYPTVPLQEGDLHLIFDDDRNVCKVFKKGEAEPVMTFPMRNDTVKRWWQRWGWCPRGVFLVGSPTDVHAPAFGFHFTPLFDLSADGPMHKEQRSGIGIHGGGSSLRNPYLPEQGWCPTHGCLRVQNKDAARLVQLLRLTQAQGRKAYITVGGQAG